MRIIHTYSSWNICFLENLALADTVPGEALKEDERPAGNQRDRADFWRHTPKCSHMLSMQQKFFDILS